MQILLIYFWVAFSLGCSDTEFSSQNGSSQEEVQDQIQSDTQPPQTKQQDSSDQPTDTSSEDSEKNPDQDIDKAPDQANLSDDLVHDICDGKESKTVNILIVDTKSGWLAGDGGNTYQSVATDFCPGKKSTITTLVDYVHLTEELIEVQAMSEIDYFDRAEHTFSNIDEYEALFFLGGDLNDKVDIAPDSDMMLSLLNEVAEAKSNNPSMGFFISAGLSNISLANVFMQTIFTSEIGVDTDIFNYGPHLKRGILPEPAKYRGSHIVLEAATGYVAKGQYLKDHPLFIKKNSLDQIIDSFPGVVDYPASEVGSCPGDDIAFSHSDLVVLAKDACGQKTLATITFGEHKVIFDANTTRFYSDVTSEFNRVYLRHLVSYLGQ